MLRSVPMLVTDDSRLDRDVADDRALLCAIEIELATLSRVELFAA